MAEKKLIYIPYIMEPMFKALNLDINDVDWSGFNSDNLKGDKFKIPIKDREFLLAVNEHLHQWLGTSSISVTEGSWVDWRDDSSFITRAESMNELPTIRSMFKLEYDEFKPYVVVWVDSSRLTDYKHINKETYIEFLNLLRMYNFKTLFGFSKVRQMFSF